MTRVENLSKMHLQLQQIKKEHEKFSKLVLKSHPHIFNCVTLYNTSLPVILSLLISSLEYNSWKESLIRGEEHFLGHMRGHLKQLSSITFSQVLVRSIISMDSFLLDSSLFIRTMYVITSFLYERTFLTTRKIRLIWDVWQLWQLK